MQKVTSFLKKILLLKVEGKVPLTNHLCIQKNIKNTTKSTKILSQCYIRKCLLINQLFIHNCIFLLQNCTFSQLKLTIICFIYKLNCNCKVDPLL